MPVAKWYEKFWSDICTLGVLLAVADFKTHPIDLKYLQKATSDDKQVNVLSLDQNFKNIWARFITSAFTAQFTHEAAYSWNKEVLKNEPRSETNLVENPAVMIGCYYLNW